MSLHFSKEEFKSRKSNILNSMKEQNIDALLMFRQESMYWLTGYDTFGYVFFQTLVLDQKGNLILLTRAPDLRQAQNTSIINDIRIWVDKDGSNPTDDLKIILDELNLKGKKIGIVKDLDLSNLDNDVVEVYENSLKEFQSLGADLVDISLPNLALSVPTYYVVAPAECSSNLSRFDGVKFGRILHHQI